VSGQAGAESLVVEGGQNEDGSQSCLFDILALAWSVPRASERCRGTPAMKVRSQPLEIALEGHATAIRLNVNTTFRLVVSVQTLVKNAQHIATTIIVASTSSIVRAITVCAIACR
jgi:hypothetical protein